VWGICQNQDLQDFRISRIFLAPPVPLSGEDSCSAIGHDKDFRDFFGTLDRQEFYSGKGLSRAVAFVFFYFISMNCKKKSQTMPFEIFFTTTISG
jgi:hypothetical protein